MDYNEPQYALVEVEGGYVVEIFDAEKHTTKWGTPAGVNLFCCREDVDHLRDQILN